MSFSFLWLVRASTGDALFAWTTPIVRRAFPFFFQSNQIAYVIRIRGDAIT